MHDPSWEHYPQTILEFFTAPGLRVDLRMPLTANVLDAFAQRGLPERFAVLTADNPHGQRVPEEVNRSREGQLHEALVRLGVPWVRADGVSSDGAHRERGVACDIPREQAICLAREFGQSALFYFEARTFWLVGASVDTATLKLPACDDRS